MKKKKTPQLPISSLPAIPCADKYNEAIISMNHRLEIKSWNKGAERIYGIERRQALGKSLPAVIVFAFIGDTLSSFVRQLSRKGQWHGEMMYIRKDRVVHFMQVSVNAVYDPLGYTIGYVAIISEEANNDAARSNLFKPIFDAEYRFVGLVNADTSQAWEMVLHWEE